MKRWLAVELGLLMMAAWTASAQVVNPESKFLVWDHDGQNVSKFQMCIDSAPCQDVGLPNKDLKGAGTYAQPLGTLPVGQHTVLAKACLNADCTASQPLAFAVVIVTAPGNLRIVGEVDLR